MISQSDLEAALFALLGKVRRIRPNDRASNPEAFHEDRGDVAGDILVLLDRVRGIAPRSTPAAVRTSAEIRHAARMKAHGNPPAATAAFARR